MSIHNKTDILTKLTESAQRMTRVRKIAETERVSQQLQENEPPPSINTPLQTSPSSQIK